MKHRRIRNFQSLFWIKFGSWKPLPESCHISVRKIKESYTNHKGHKVRNNVSRVYLITPTRGNNFLLYEAIWFDEATAEAIRIGGLLNLPVKTAKQEKALAK